MTASKPRAMFEENPVCRMAGVVYDILHLMVYSDQK